jgi:hemerythrin
MLVTWEPRHELGLVEIDAEHRVVVDVINRLNTMSASGVPTSDLSAVAEDLHRYVQTHFDREERLMAAARYADLAAHKAEHEGFARKVAEFRQKLGTGVAAADLSTLLMHLVNWWMSHIGRTDPQYVPALKTLRGG